MRMSESEEKLFSHGTYSLSNDTPPSLLVSVPFTMTKRVDSSRFEKFFLYWKMLENLCIHLVFDLICSLRVLTFPLKSLLKRYRRDYGELAETAEDDPQRRLGRGYCFGTIKMMPE